VRNAERDAFAPSGLGRKAMKEFPSWYSQMAFPIDKMVHMKARKPKI